jgi:hypothetical protein
MGIFDSILSRHTCECGAVYKKTSYRSPIPDSDYEDCVECGRRMDSWHNSTSVREYELIKST